MSDELDGQKPTNQQAPGNDNPSNEDLDQDIDFSDDERSAFDEETGKKVSSLSAQKKHWREKHDKVNKDFEEYKKRNPEKKDDPIPPKEEKPSKKNDDSRVEKLESEIQEMRLAQANPGVPADEIKRAMRLAKAEGTDAQEFINSDYFQTYLKTKAEKAAQENATPGPSNRSGNPRTNFDNLTSEQISELSDADYAKYQKYLRDKEGSGSSGLTVRASSNF